MQFRAGIEVDGTIEAYRRRGRDSSLIDAAA